MSDAYEMWLSVRRVEAGERPPHGYSVLVDPGELKKQYTWLLARHDEGTEADGLLNFLSVLMHECGDDWAPAVEDEPVPPVVRRIDL